MENENIKPDIKPDIEANRKLPISQLLNLVENAKWFLSVAANGEETLVLDLTLEEYSKYFCQNDFEFDANTPLPLPNITPKERQDIAKKLGAHDDRNRIDPYFLFYLHKNLKNPIDPTMPLEKIASAKRAKRRAKIARRAFDKTKIRSIFTVDMRGDGSHSISLRFPIQGKFSGHKEKIRDFFKQILPKAPTIPEDLPTFYEALYRFVTPHFSGYPSDQLCEITNALTQQLVSTGYRDERISTTQAVDSLYFGDFIDGLKRHLETDSAHETTSRPGTGMSTELDKSPYTQVATQVWNCFLTHEQSKPFKQLEIFIMAVDRYCNAMALPSVLPIEALADLLSTAIDEITDHIQFIPACEQALPAHASRIYDDSRGSPIIFARARRIPSPSELLLLELFTTSEEESALSKQNLG